MVQSPGTKLLPPKIEKFRMLLSKFVQTVKSTKKIVSSTTDFSMTLITFISEH